jgi:hypothetical protein
MILIRKRFQGFCSLNVRSDTAGAPLLFYGRLGNVMSGWPLEGLP